MNPLFLVIVAIISVHVRATDKNLECVTPNLETALCVPARSCKVILDAIRTRNQTAIEFAQKSQCGYDKEPLVCCGSTGYPQPETASILDIFSKPPVITERAPFATEKPLVLENFDTDKLPDRTVCGLHKVTDRIVGGTVTAIGEFPWMVALEFEKLNSNKREVSCGGSIINKEYVLTAAHCVKNIEFKLVAAILGEWKISTDPDCNNKAINDCADRVVRIGIDVVTAHPYYSNRDGSNDIAMIRLEREIEFSDYIRPICLPPDNLPPAQVNDPMTVSGWGATTYYGKINDVKLKVTVPLVSNEACRKKITTKKISQSHICAGGEVGRDSCQGDSGGPLMRSYKDQKVSQEQWFLEGVVSSGVGCGGADYPALYTKVSKYIRWIISTIY